jgi:hypothetical protein
MRHSVFKLVGHLAILGMALPICGCLSLTVGDGEAHRPEDYATVIGDPKFRSGAPMSLLLRKIDDRVVDVRYDKVKVPAGTHTLLVDCQIDGMVASRHPIEAELYGQTRYRIVGDSAAGNRDCSNVRLEAVD